MRDIEGGAESEVSILLERIQHLKHEHAPLLAKIQRDSGMSAALRYELLAHLKDEEAEIITKLAAISPVLAARYRPGVPGPVSADKAPPNEDAAPQTAAATRRAAAERDADVQRLTVGSLRAGATQARSTAPATAARTAGRQARLSIGSLRPR